MSDDKIEYNQELAKELADARDSLNVRILLEKLSQLEHICIKQYRKLQEQYGELLGLRQHAARGKAAAARQVAYRKQHRELTRAHRLLLLEHKALAENYRRLIVKYGNSLTAKREIDDATR